MPFAVEMYMDAESDAVIRRAWKALAETGIKSAMLDAGYEPHVSLGVCEALDVEGLAKELSSFAEKTPPLALTLSSVGLFASSEGVVFLGVAPTQRLLEVHGAFHRFFGNYAQAQRAYQIGSWVPHCTLAFGLSADSIAAAVEVCRRVPLPIHSRIERVGIAKVSPQRATVLCSYQLRGVARFAPEPYA